ncbi:uncharacterized protein AB9W97_011709 [Spinachia spinachia]
MEVRRLTRVLHHQPHAAELPMDAGEPRRPSNACLQNFPKSPLWIIEYVWAHKMMEVQEVVDPSNWPEVDSQPLSLEDSWRLRVSSARVFSIVKNRDMKHYDRVVGFLEATYRLLPGLVASIKHMKIAFGLKTLVIMKMLREGRGAVETVLKTSQFFPSKLPQYQAQCSQPEMFLMRKNHRDFKTLAQALALNKDKLEHYIKHQMEEQYGEHYAQKVEDRLLHYLQELEAALPGDTYIDQILQKESPVTEEEKLLMEVITSDSANIATTLKKLLHCEAASCRPGSVSRSAAHGRTARESSPLSQSAPCRRPSGALRSTGAEGSPGQEASASPQFCSKHQRWVRSILQECPDARSDELLPRADVSSSPLLFLSSSPDCPSSEDLTPSDIIQCPPDQQRPPPQTSTNLLTAVQASEGSAERLLSSRDTDVSTRASPVGRLTDIASVIFKPCRVLLKRLPVPVFGPEGLSSPHPKHRRAQHRSPALPLPSKRLQPYVRVQRLGAREGRHVTTPRSPSTRVAAVLRASKDDVQKGRGAEGEEEKDADSSFDVNALYSGESSSDSEDSFHGDPEYKPRFKKKRLLSD